MRRAIPCHKGHEADQSKSCVGAAKRTSSASVSVGKPSIVDRIPGSPWTVVEMTEYLRRSGGRLSGKKSELVER